MAVANDADDLYIEGARTATEFHELAECLAIGEIFLRESLVDDGDFGAGLIIGEANSLPCRRRDPEIRKMSGADAVFLTSGVSVMPGRVTLLLRSSSAMRGSSAEALGRGCLEERRVFVQAENREVGCAADRSR